MRPVKNSFFFQVVKWPAVAAVSLSAILATLASLGVIGWSHRPVGSWTYFGVNLAVLLFIMLFVEERWKDACPFTKLARYCVFRPRRLVCFGWWVTVWAAHGLTPLEYPGDPTDPDDWCVKFTRRETLEHFWIISRSMADIDMQNWYSIEECKAKLHNEDRN